LIGRSSVLRVCLQSLKVITDQTRRFLPQLFPLPSSFLVYLPIFTVSLFLEVPNLPFPLFLPRFFALGSLYCQPNFVSSKLWFSDLSIQALHSCWVACAPQTRVLSSLFSVLCLFQLVSLPTQPPSLPVCGARRSRATAQRGARVVSLGRLCTTTTDTACAIVGSGPCTMRVTQAER
jgi:hypothetical protein